MEINLTTLKNLLMFMRLYIKDYKTLYEKQQGINAEESEKARGTFEESKALMSVIEEIASSNEPDTNYAIFLSAHKKFFERNNSIQQQIGILQSRAQVSNETTLQIAYLKGQSAAYEVLYKHLVDDRLRNA